AKSPEERYQTMAEVLAEFDRCRTEARGIAAGGRPTSEDRDLRDVLKNLAASGGEPVNDTGRDIQTQREVTFPISVDLTAKTVETNPLTANSLPAICPELVESLPANL